MGDLFDLIDCLTPVGIGILNERFDDRRERASSITVQIRRCVDCVFEPMVDKNSHRGRCMLGKIWNEGSPYIIESLLWNPSNGLNNKKEDNTYQVLPGMPVGKRNPLSVYIKRSLISFSLGIFLISTAAI